MGFALDLASIEGLDKDEALRRLGYVDTGRKTDRIGRDVAWATTSKGRVVVIARYGWLKPERLADLSAGTSLVAGRFETHVGDSNAWGYRDGDCVWSVLYPAEGSGLTVEGAPPPEFAVIRDRLLAERRAEAKAHFPQEQVQPQQPQREQSPTVGVPQPMEQGGVGLGKPQRRGQQAKQARPGRCLAASRPR